MDSEKNKNWRQSPRMKDYDYSRDGYYFITIVCNKRYKLFGTCKDGNLVNNEAGKMIEKWYLKLPEKFPFIICHEFVVMPDHFHCQVQLKKSAESYFNDSISIPTVIQWLKTMTTNEYIRGVKSEDWPRFYKRLWQVSYHDSIVENKKGVMRVNQYILNNPVKFNKPKR